MSPKQIRSGWKLVAEVTIDMAKGREMDLGTEGEQLSFLFHVTNSQWGEWFKKYRGSEVEDEEFISLYELDMVENGPVRSTSVGDVFRNVAEDKFIMVMGVGFKEIKMESVTNTNKYTQFPKKFGDTEKMWKSKLKEWPDFVGMRMSGMTNQGTMRDLGSAIFRHVEEGEYKIEKDIDDWVTKMSISIANPVDEKSFRTIRDGPYLKERKVVDTILFPTVNSAYSAATRLAKYWEYSNYRGLPVYKEVFGLED